ncbi:hypothetical protein [Brucella anthropi]|uniref:hypothetical protein n=1 Tax=Brucella anthropi TaxID=529 RepID=UPI001CFDB977|nr:hypothetical protein [Brucella anthropi]
MINYVIVKIRHCTDKLDRRSLVVSMHDEIANFASQKNAREYIRHIDRGEYRLNDNEISRPDYKICRLEHLPRYLAAMVTRRGIDLSVDSYEDLMSSDAVWV